MAFESGAANVTGPITSGPGALFDQAQNKLSWLDTRQRVLAQNIANADTPGYRARDITPFSSHIAALTVAPQRTSPLHLAGLTESEPGSFKIVAEQAPDGNSVTLETQMTKVADVEGAQALVGNLWKTYMGMYMMALGHGS